MALTNWMIRWLPGLVAVAAIVATLSLVVAFAAVFGVPSAGSRLLPGLSIDPSHWGSFGAYVGGAAGALCGLATVVLVWATLLAARDANAKLDAELQLAKQGRELEQLRARIELSVLGVDRYMSLELDLPWLLASKIGSPSVFQSKRSLWSAVREGQIHFFIEQLPRLKSHWQT